MFVSSLNAYYSINGRLLIEYSLYLLFVYSYLNIKQFELSMLSCIVAAV